MHKVGEGEFCPGREKESEDRRRNAEGVKKIAKDLPRLEDVDDDEKNIDTAKVQGEIVDVVVSEGGEDDNFQYLVQNDQACYGDAETVATLVTAFGIEKATDHRDQNECDQPRNVRDVKRRKAHTAYDRAR